MRVDFSGIQRLKPAAITLRKPCALERTSDLMEVIKYFASRMSMRVIPAETVEKLKNDPYFRYCFIPIIDHGDNLFTSDTHKDIRDRTHELLLQPDLANATDLCNGLILYMNNFPEKMPGGWYRTWKGWAPGAIEELQPLFNQIDQILEGKTDKALALKEISDKEKEGYNAKLEYLLLCLDVHKTLVEKNHYDSTELWR